MHQNLIKHYINYDNIKQKIFKRKNKLIRLELSKINLIEKENYLKNLDGS